MATGYLDTINLVFLTNGFAAKRYCGEKSEKKKLGHRTGFADN